MRINAKSGYCRCNRSEINGIVLRYFRYVALYHYAPVKEDELELVKGEYYTVTEKCQDGWYKGASMKSGRVGVFPGNYVQFR